MIRYICATKKSGKHTFQAGLSAVWVLCLLAGMGCAETRMTEPKRTAEEMLLLSTAAHRAIHQFEVGPYVKGRKVYIDPTYFDVYEQQYVMGTLRALFSSKGALLVEDKKAAEIVVEPRSAALSTDSSNSLLGFPAIPVPIPAAGTFKTPEISLFKSRKQNSVAKFALLAYDNTSRTNIFSTEPAVGEAFSHHYVLLGYIRYNTSDIPERKHW